MVSCPNPAAAKHPLTLTLLSWDDVRNLEYCIWVTPNMFSGLVSKLIKGPVVLFGCSGKSSPLTRLTTILFLMASDSFYLTSV